MNPIKIGKDPNNYYAYLAFYFKNGFWYDVGWAMLDDSRTYIDIIWVKPEFKNLGIGTAIIEFINNDLGYNIKPDIYKNRTKEGKAFFKLKKNPKSKRNKKFLRKKSKKNNPENPYFDSIKKVLKFQRNLNTQNMDYKFPDIKEWVAVNWKPDEGTFDVYKLLYVTIQKRIVNSQDESIFVRSRLNSEYDLAWRNFLERINEISDKYGYIDLEKLTK